MDSEKLEVIHNPAESRFEIRLNGQLAKLDYMEDGDSIVMTHVGVPIEFRGHGIAAIITKAGLDYAKAKSLRVIPMCSYVAAYLRRNPQYIELTRSKE
ncbi:MAG TPA: GNAT family N-acetyltransferase [Anaerolineales bacterium]|nr:GNAT family N-acetyltransferase [Anaerolineales bacterium]